MNEDGIKYLVDTLSLSYHASCRLTRRNIRAHRRYVPRAYIKRRNPSCLRLCFDEPDHVGHPLP